MRFTKDGRRTAGGCRDRSQNRTSTYALSGQVNESVSLISQSTSTGHHYLVALRETGIVVRGQKENVRTIEIRRRLDDLYVADVKIKRRDNAIHVLLQLQLIGLHCIGIGR